MAMEKHFYKVNSAAQATILLCSKVFRENKKRNQVGKCLPLPISKLYQYNLKITLVSPNKDTATYSLLMNGQQLYEKIVNIVSHQSDTD